MLSSSYGYEGAMVPRTGLHSGASLPRLQHRFLGSLTPSVPLGGRDHLLASAAPAPGTRWRKWVTHR